MKIFCSDIPVAPFWLVHNINVASTVESLLGLQSSPLVEGHPTPFTGKDRNGEDCEEPNL